MEASLKIYDSHIAHLRIGEIYLQEENFQKAYEHFDYVFDEFRYQPGFLYEFADIQKMLGKKEEAEKTINELNKIDADFIMKKQIMETFGKASSNP